MKTLALTGHRPKGFPWEYNAKNEEEHICYLQNLKDIIKNFALNGYSHFISGGAIGADLDFANIVLDLHKNLPITLEIAVPCPNQDLKWNTKDKKNTQKLSKKPTR